MKQYDTYLFDFDGTLFDTEASLRPVWDYAFSKQGVTAADEEKEEFMHHPLAYAAEKKGIKDYPTFEKDITSALDFPESLALVTMYPDTVSVITSLFAWGRRLGIVSSNNTHHISLVLQEKKMDPYFSVLSGSDLYVSPKPSADPILYALSKLGLSPRDSICYVGDSPIDAECAKNAGVDGYLLDRKGKHQNWEGNRLRSLTELVF